MAMTSVANRAQLCQVARPAAVKPARRVVQVAAKHESPLKLAARSGAAAAAAALLLVRTDYHRQDACLGQRDCIQLLSPTQSAASHVA